jgi:O-antigen/teichoic acid export membrane protein
MGLIQRIVATLLGLVFLVAILVFASLALGILLAVGLVVWVWLWWRMRGKLPRERQRGGSVVEGEYRDVTPTQRITRDPNQKE